ncbi:MAG: tetratricopeptide repeat protein, partial [Acidobacteriota bacterium]
YSRELIRIPELFEKKLKLALFHVERLLDRLAESSGSQETALRAHEAIVAGMRETSEKNPASVEFLARSLFALAARVERSGQPEQALETIQEAVDLYRRLVSEESPSYRLPLAGSLNNLGQQLRRRGRIEEARDCFREGIALYRALEHEEPHPIQPQIAAMLGNLSFTLRNLGQTEEALRVSEESLRRLAELRDLTPSLFKGWVGPLAAEYRDAVAAAGSEANPELLASISPTG